MLRVLLVLACIGAITQVPAVAEENEASSGYVGSGTCRGCHTDEYDAWQTSKHAGSINGSDKPSEQNQGWIENCSGCHTTGMDVQELTWSEKGVGCEACHGPGQDHVKSPGSADKIVKSDAADICGRCHGGNLSGDGLMSDGTRWVVGYRPGMKLSDVPGLRMSSLNPEELPPPPVNNHPLTYNMWKASGHSKTSEQTFTIGDKKRTGPVTCVVCHDPHQSGNPKQLVMDPDELCSSCHSQYSVLKGKGAKGIEDTRSLHTAISCMDCHMTEGNHLMRVLRPDNPDLAESRMDSCSACHEVKDRKIRASQIQDWEAWYRETMEPVQAYLRAIDNTLKNNPNLLDAGLEEKLKDAKANLAFIEQDGSNGVHNLDYALEIMALAKRDLAKIKAAIE